MLRDASSPPEGNFEDGVARLMARVRTADADTGSGQKMNDYFETRILSKLRQNEKVTGPSNANRYCNYKFISTCVSVVA